MKAFARSGFCGRVLALPKRRFLIGFLAISIAWAAGLSMADSGTNVTRSFPEYTIPVYDPFAIPRLQRQQDDVWEGCLIESIGYQVIGFTTGPTYGTQGTVRFVGTTNNVGIGLPGPGVYDRGLYIGMYPCTGRMELAQGSVCTVGADAYVGFESRSIGTLTLGPGCRMDVNTSPLPTNMSTMAVGWRGDGTLSLTGASISVTGCVFIGTMTGSIGRVYLTRSTNTTSGVRWTNTLARQAGSTGMVAMVDSLLDGRRLIIGEYGVAALTATASTIWFNSEDVALGAGSSGRLVLHGSTNNVTADFYAGHNSNAVGTVAMAGSFLRIGGFAGLGDNGYGRIFATNSLIMIGSNARIGWHCRGEIHLVHSTQTVRQLILTLSGGGTGMVTLADRSLLIASNGISIGASGYLTNRGESVVRLWRSGLSVSTGGAFAVDASAVEFLGASTNQGWANVAFSGASSLLFAPTSAAARGYHFTSGSFDPASSGALGVMVTGSHFAVRDDLETRLGQTWTLAKASVAVGSNWNASGSVAVNGSTCSVRALSVRGSGSWSFTDGLILATNGVAWSNGTACVVGDALGASSSAVIHVLGGESRFENGLRIQPDGAVIFGAGATGDVRGATTNLGVIRVDNGAVVSCGDLLLTGNGCLDIASNAAWQLNGSFVNSSTNLSLDLLHGRLDVAPGRQGTFELGSQNRSNHPSGFCGNDAVGTLGVAGVANASGVMYVWSLRGGGTLNISNGCRVFYADGAGWSGTVNRVGDGVFQQVSFAPTNISFANGMTMRWPAGSGLNFAVEWAPGLADGAFVLATNITSAGTSETWSDTGAVDRLPPSQSTNRFYRIRAWP
jgi:hypothetical protein